MGAGFKEVLARLGLVVASVLVSVLFVEFGLRVSGYAPEPFPNARRIKDASRTLLLDCYPSNPRGYFDVDLEDPGTYARYEARGVRRLDRARHWAPHCIEFRYNSLRYRDREFGPRRDGVTRVAVLGDSFTEGWGVRQEHTYPVILGNLLDQAEPGRWEVLNCGRRGEDFPSLYERFSEVLELEPDVVLYGMVLNDPVKSKSFGERQQYVSDWILAQGRRTRRRYSRLAFFQPRIGFLLEELLEGYRLQHESTRWYLEMYGEANREGWARTQQLVREMNRRLRERGGRLLVATWPLLVALDETYPFVSVHESIRGFFEQSGIEHHDLLDDLKAEPTDSLVVYPVDRHPNEKAHAIAARSLLADVRRLAVSLDPEAPGQIR